MHSGLKRKEVWLPKSVLAFFEAKAKEKKWSLKKYMEDVLVEKYHEFRKAANSSGIK